MKGKNNKFNSSSLEYVLLVKMLIYMKNCRYKQEYLHMQQKLRVTHHVDIAPM